MTYEEKRRKALVYNDLLWKLVCIIQHCALRLNFFWKVECNWFPVTIWDNGLKTLHLNINLDFPFIIFFRIYFLLPLIVYEVYTYIFRVQPVDYLWARNGDVFNWCLQNFLLLSVRRYSFFDFIVKNGVKMGIKLTGIPNKVLLFDDKVLKYDDIIPVLSLS